MKNIHFIDLNPSLVRKVEALGIKATCGDYFREAYKQIRPVFMTASNPMFTFGGGLDALFIQHFPKLCDLKQMKGGGNERIANVCFTITVDEHLKATKETVTEAIEFAIGNIAENETLILSGVGTGIGGLSEADFLQVLKNVYEPHTTNTPRE